ncbi:hypothetical protein EGD80_10510 [Bacillus subtilis]|nr:hypothetical protein EGD80_10510 [Bacillus subtilis]
MWRHIIFFEKTNIISNRLFEIAKRHAGKDTKESVIIKETDVKDGELKTSWKSLDREPFDKQD